MFNVDQLAQTKQRYEARTSERAGTEAKIKAGAILEADAPERVRSRLLRKGIDLDTVESVMSGQISVVSAASVPARVLNTLERIIGRDDLINATFLVAGARACRAVCRVEIGESNGLVAGYGTGVMVSPRLMLTNNHVLDSAAVAAASQAEFGYEDDDEGRVQASVRFALEPDTLFVTDAELDYSVVAVSPQSTDGRALRDYGWVPLIEQQGKAIKGECVNIIQHPNGEPKRLALRENQIIDLLENFMHYKTDTAPGSSGSPVFNDEWEMVALHHSGVPARDAEGNLLAIDGGIWTEEMGEHRVKWVANEGVRVSRLIARLREHDLPEAQRRLLQEAFTENEDIAPAPLPAAEEERGSVRQRLSPVAANGHSPATEATVPMVADDTVTWTIPIQVTARLGTPLVGATIPTLGPSLTSVPAALPTPITVGSGSDRQPAALAERKRGLG